MKQIAFKTTEKSMGILSPQHSSIKPGLDESGQVITYLITDIPDYIPTLEVLRLAQGTVFMSNNCFQFNFDQIGIGKIVR